MKQNLLSGPILALVSAKTHVFRFYSSGILDSTDCGQEELNHAVIIVGHGKENGLDYFVVRNSYGTDWGEQGYAKIAAAPTGHGFCGLQSVSLQVKTKAI